MLPEIEQNKWTHHDLQKNILTASQHEVQVGNSQVTPWNAHNRCEDKSVG